MSRHIGSLSGGGNRTKHMGLRAGIDPASPHTDPRAERGALAVALVASGADIIALPDLMDTDEELWAILGRVARGQLWETASDVLLWAMCTIRLERPW